MMNSVFDVGSLFIFIITAPDYNRQAWTNVKNSLGLPIPNLPYYIDGDIKVTQSNAILRYIGRKHDLLGQTEAEKVNVDMMLDQAMDFRNGLVRLAYSRDYEKLKESYFKDLGKKLEIFETFLGSNDWFAGDKITICDFHIYELLDQHRIMDPTCLENFKKLQAFLDRFEELPKIKAYLNSDKCIKRPINNKIAAFK
ncbi:hypothetical protein KUTeg_020653 [Tegillarca granosa]|uniref:glutathione transferase n=1 Tax=Tegillarca granosa TaxID=220873 RepID=A0ABQ9EB95_TEGGR|nr:hypothetical protein KUTeg_020653 [Tegillarca granosa]